MWENNTHKKKKKKKKKYLGAKLKLKQVEVNFMKDLFLYFKRYACFTVGNTKLYLQKEGFAMGSYDSGDGANLVLLKSEYLMLQDSTISTGIKEFFRFIDDGSLTVELKPQSINSFLKKLVAHYPKELEIEFKVTKFITVFLDISYGISYETYSDSKFHYRIFQKPFNTYSYLNWASSRENLSSGFSTRSDSNRPVQSQKLARGLKFQI